MFSERELRNVYASFDDKVTKFRALHCGKYERRSIDGTGINLSGTSTTSNIVLCTSRKMYSYLQK